jgi:hypothetical protein
MKLNFLRGGALGLGVMLVLLSLGRAQASLAPATSMTRDAMRADDLRTVQRFLEQKEVAQHLAGLGLDAPNIEARLHNLSDQELHEVAMNVEQQLPARDGGAILTILTIGILVLLFVYLLKRV